MAQDGQRLNRGLNLVHSSYISTKMEVRVEQPIQAMRMLGAHVHQYQEQIGLMNDAIPGVPNILLIQRCLAQANLWPTVVKTAISRGWLVVADWDDYPITPVKSNEARWEESMKWDMFSCCHAIQTTTPSLRDVFLKFNPEVALFPNQIGEMPPYLDRTDRRPRIFFGAFNRGAAWKPLITGINRVLKKFPNVPVVVVHDQAFFKALKTKSKAFVERLSYADYMKSLTSCDIALLPLHDDEFTRHKSDVKFLEAAAARTAVIASPTVYADTIDDGVTGVIAKTPAEWEAALGSLLADKGRRLKLAHNAHRYVLKHRMLANHIHKNIDWYYDLWDRRHALTEALLKRHPNCMPD